MQDIGYLKPKKNDVFVISIISFTLSLLFSIIILRFSSFQNDLTPVFTEIFILLNIMFYLRLIIMKYIGLKNAVEVEMDITYFNRYGLRVFETLTDKNKNSIFTPNKFKIPKLGLSTIIISIILYILTLGFFVYPSIWKFKFKKIKHLFHGSAQHHEFGHNILGPYEVTDHRISKIYNVGFFFYFLFAQLIEFLLKGNSDLYPWEISIIFYIAIFTLIPIPGSDGFEIYTRSGGGINAFYYPILLTILFIGMLSIIAIESEIFTILVVLFAFIYTFFSKMWKKLT